MNDSPATVLDQIIFLYEKYSNEHRASTQPFHLQKVKKLVKNYHYRYDDLLVREPLIEHSGSLPIVATTVFPHIKNRHVNLGNTLIMLAIHDIGELVVHDEISFNKKEEHAPHEQQAALKLLPAYYHPYYLEMENRTTDTGKFAKAIDKMTPDIVDLMTPAEITIERYRQFVNQEPRQIVATIKKFKHPYMPWNKFMKDLHLEILARIDRKLKKYY